MFPQTLSHARIRLPRSRITSINRSFLHRRSADRDAANSSICCGDLFTSTHLLLIIIIYLKSSSPGTVRALTNVRPPGFFSVSPGSFHQLLCPLLTSPERSEAVTRHSAEIPSHATSQAALRRPPGVNRCLLMRECRVYGYAL